MKKNLRWRTIPYTYGFYQISNKGNLRKITNSLKCFTLYSFTKSKYEDVQYFTRKFKYQGIHFDYPVVRYKTEYGLEVKPICSLVYEAFHGIFNIPIENIMHIDGNEFNNDIDNLILCPKDDRYKYAFDKNINKCFFYIPTVDVNGFKTYTDQLSRICVSEYGINGSRINIYRSIAHVSEELNIPRHELEKVFDGIKKLEYEGRIFKLGYGPEFIDVHLIAKNQLIPFNSTSSYNFKLVFKYHKNGKLDCIYNNLKEAGEKNRIKFDELKHVLLESKLYADSIWMFE